MKSELFFILSIFWPIYGDNCINILECIYNSTVVVNCADKKNSFDPKIHTISWSTFDGQIENKPPYQILSNGSLIVVGLTQSAYDIFCEVSKLNSSDVLYRCGTSISVVQPLFIHNTPRNETVRKNHGYWIKCIAGGGDMKVLTLQYFVNNSEVFVGGPFPINGTTKIECLAISGKDRMSVVAYIEVENLADEELFKRTTCGSNCSRLCDLPFIVNKSILCPESKESHDFLENIIGKLFRTLKEKVYHEYNEDKCLERFQRLICSILYPSCTKGSNIITHNVCKESCDVVIFMICRKTIADLYKQIEFFNTGLLDINRDKSLPTYYRDYVANISGRINEVFKCSGFPSSSNSSCNLVNLDETFNSTKGQEKASKKCYDNNGRNYNGLINVTNSKNCTEWKRLPQVTAAFYQQNLLNAGSYCRNPGGVYSQPVCPIATNNPYGDLDLNSVRILICTEIIPCSSERNVSPITTAAIGIFVIPIIIIVIITVVVVVVLFVVKRLTISKKNRKVKRNESNEMFNCDNFELYSNKLYNYKTVQTGYYSCPVYNAAYLEAISSVGESAFGEIVLVHAVLDIPTPHCDNEFPSLRRFKSSKPVSDVESSYLDDFILTKDKTFHGKPCWPFDNSTISGSCPFAVIKYFRENNKPLMHSKFVEETKYMAQFFHDHIIRFYGVTCNNTRTINARIVEYLPNGNLKSILNGTVNSMSSKSHGKVRNGYQSMNAIKKTCYVINNIKEDTIPLKRKKNNSSQSRDILPPAPAEHIDLSHRQLVTWAIHICDAINYLHVKHLLHRDIAARNCLVSASLDAKLADFTFVVKYAYGQNIIGNADECISIAWLPKETLEDLIFNTDTDMWMFGVFLWELMSLGQQPYGHVELYDVYEKVKNGVILERPVNCPDAIYDQMKLCWSDVNDRPSPEDIKSNLESLCKNL